MPRSEGVSNPIRTLIIDNYDSYTYNLYQLLQEVNGEAPLVIKNDEKSIEEVQAMVQALGVDNIVVSPGPGSPNNHGDTGICRDIFRAFEHVPILGVCLGHQILGAMHGADIIRAPEPVHGRLSDISHKNHSLFHNIPSGRNSGFEVVRYHSLVIDADTLPSHVVPIAWTSGHHHALRVDDSSLAAERKTSTSPTEEGILMAIAVDRCPHYGVQFHPESIGTSFGKQLIQNFRYITCKLNQKELLPMVIGPAAPTKHVFVSAAEGWEGNLEIFYEKCTGILSGEASEMSHLFHSLFGRTQQARDTFWLDSAAAQQSRFSFMGGIGGPLWQCLSYKLDNSGLQSSGDKRVGELRIRDADGTVKLWRGNLWDYLHQDIKCRRMKVTRADLSELPFDFWGGYVGYLGYELKALCGGANSHGSSTPDACLFLADRLIVVDHKERDVYCVAMRFMEEENAKETEDWVLQTCSEVRSILAKTKIQPGSKIIGLCPSLNHVDLKLKIEQLSKVPNSGCYPRAGYTLDHSHPSYCASIERCLEYMAAGESYEICLTNKLRKPTCEGFSPLRFYDVLRDLNPAPYSAFMNFGMEDVSICCSSPERFLKGGRGAVLESKPIKGTAARSSDPQRDAEAAHQLATSEKDQAENLMIVDLVRNDLGKVCEAGSLNCQNLMKVESFATVHQLVSTVRCVRRKDVSIISAIRSAFPGGSMTGAPKVRTMELLDDLEGQARGVYSGSIGFIGFNDTFDLNIVIRTAVIHNHEMTIGTGGAIVVQSNIQGEFDEMVLKTRAVVRATEAYESSFKKLF